ncbi:MAG: pentapeptide repeat-containing protein [Candidatus Brocadiales bacterium]
MDYIKKSLLTAAFAVSFGFVPMVPGMQSQAAYGASVEENIETLRSTNSCPGCDLHGADLRNTNLEEANLNGANLRNANLSGCELQNVDFRGANLEAADLKRSDFHGAMMSGVSLNGAWVKGADFLSVNGLTPEQKKYLKDNGAIVRD